MARAEAVVVTGVGVISPIGTGAAEFCDGLLAGRSGGVLIEDFDTTGWRSRVACRVPRFNPTDWLSPRAARQMDRAAQFAIATARMAIADAGLEMSALDPERAGAVTATCAPMEWVWNAHKACFTGGGARSVPPRTVLATFPDAPAARIAIDLGLRGPCHAISTACASGTDAVGHARLLLRAGLADVMLAGGVEAPIVPSSMIAFGQARALSQRNDEPATASRPFCATRDGFVMGEGAGLVVLERGRDARARGARIYGEIAGYGVSTDAHHMTAPEPSGAQRIRAVRAALADAGASADDVGYVNAHGTGTPLNDANETAVIRAALGPRADRVPVSATKSMVGHSLGAAGGIELVATLLTMRAGQVHPTINLHEADPACDLDYVTGGARRHRFDCALSLAFGFGGKNAVVVVRRA